MSHYELLLKMFFVKLQDTFVACKIHVVFAVGAESRRGTEESPGAGWILSRKEGHRLNNWTSRPFMLLKENALKLKQQNCRWGGLSRTKMNMCFTSSENVYKYWGPQQSKWYKELKTPCDVLVSFLLTLIACKNQLAEQHGRRLLEEWLML